MIFQKLGMAGGRAGVRCQVSGVKLRRQSLLDGSLELGPELPALGSKVEDIDYLFPFRVDQGNIDVAAELGEDGADLVKQARAVVGNQFEKRAVGRARVVKTELCWYGNFRFLPGSGLEAPTHELTEFHPALKDVEQVRLEAARLRRVQFQSAIKVHEPECVQSHPRSICKSVCLHDAHPPSCKRPGN